jgi:alpha-ketoglutarate-dependent taurine dioxygenase
MPVLEISHAHTGLRAEFCAVATALAADGATGDTVLSRPDAELPADLAAALDDVLRSPADRAGFRVIKGLLTGLGDPGPTPLSWQRVDHRGAAFDTALALAASRLGRVFGWAHQQGGRIVHNILPSPGQEHRQVGASSTAPLAWHTEDAFHPDRGDMLVLACVRNPDRIGSSLATVSDTRLSCSDVAQLARPLAVVLPDDSYQDDRAEQREQVGISTLWQRGDGVGIRYDPSYSRWLTDDPRFFGAYRRLGDALDAAGVMVPLDPGDVLVIDNDATVHGRCAFTPRYDGTDRWLKRILVRSDRPRPDRERLEHGYDQAQVDPYRATVLPGV